MDPDGRDIVLLLDPDRGRASWPILNLIPFGHSAALIGNDNDGWLYYSNDGPASTDVQWFDTKQDFFDNYSKSRNNPFVFIESSTVKTTTDQDQSMQLKAFELAGIDLNKGHDAKMTGERFIIGELEKPSSYSFLFNNCSQHIGQIALAGDVFSLGDLIPRMHVLMDKDSYLMFQLSQSLLSRP